MTDVGGISGNNFGDRLVKSTQEFVKLVTKTSSKIREPKTYDGVINNPIYGNR